MKTKPLPNPGKPVTTQQDRLDVIGSGGICKECLNEDVDSCVCTDPEN